MLSKIDVDVTNDMLLSTDIYVIYEIHCSKSPCRQKKTDINYAILFVCLTIDYKK